MIHLGKRTNESPSDVIEKAHRFFGPDGIGLEIALREEGAIYFVGGGGHVQVTACFAEDDKDEADTSQDGITQVDIQSMEWEKQAQDFLGNL